MDIRPEAERFVDWSLIVHPKAAYLALRGIICMANYHAAPLPYGVRVVGADESSRWISFDDEDGWEIFPASRLRSEAWIEADWDDVPLSVWELLPWELIYNLLGETT